MTNNYKSTDEFVMLVQSIVKDVLKNTNVKTEQFYDGIVKSFFLDSNSPDTDMSNPYKQVATVDIGERLLYDVPNKSGQILERGDSVRIYTTTKTNTDIYIGLKLN